MEFIRPGTNIDFVGKKVPAFILSMVILIGSLSSLIIHRGLNYGVDFAGGTLIHVKFESSIDIDQIKSKLSHIKLETSTVQAFGTSEKNEFLIKIKKIIAEVDLSKKLKTAFTMNNETSLQIKRVEIVGPQIGEKLRERALLAIFYALLLIAVYISGRFELKWTLSCFVAISLMIAVYFLSLLNIPIPIIIFSALIVTLSIFWFMKLKYAMGAIVALIHDVIIIIGIFSILNKEFSLPVVASLLTVVGYSLNDTIVVFDRIRENLKKHSSKQFSVIVNKSINETLGRTVLTSITTMIVVLTLVIYGGGVIHDFAFALMVGVIAGTYSSIYVASPILLVWQRDDS